jgi:hypothetical protein
MGIWDFLNGGTKPTGDQQKQGAIDYGKQKKGGGHDHRHNTDNDRTPAQKEGDAKRRK